MAKNKAHNSQNINGIKFNSSKYYTTTTLTSNTINANNDALWIKNPTYSSDSIYTNDYIYVPPVLANIGDIIYYKKSMWITYTYINGVGNVNYNISEPLEGYALVLSKFDYGYKIKPFGNFSSINISLHDVVRVESE